MRIALTPQFRRMFKKLEPSLQQEALEKINLLETDSNLEQLRIHKLQGRLKGRYSFSVNYKVRIIFSHLSKNEVVLLAVGNHNIYQ